jgi:hypothetical protein
MCAVMARRRATAPPSVVAVTHQSGISRGEPDRKLTFIDGARRITQLCLHIGGSELRVLSNDLLDGEAAGDEAHDCGDRDVGTGHAGNPAHDPVVDSNPR